MKKENLKLNEKEEIKKDVLYSIGESMDRKTKNFL